MNNINTNNILQEKQNEVEKENKKSWIKDGEVDWNELRKATHQHIKDNLEHYQQKMWLHYEEEKKFVQSVWGIATCGYCFKDKFQKNWMYVGNSELHEIVCRTCLFKNKLWNF